MGPNEAIWCHETENFCFSHDHVLVYQEYVSRYRFAVSIHTRVGDALHDRSYVYGVIRQAKSLPRPGIFYLVPVR
jgi:hypothetical protein